MAALQRIIILLIAMCAALSVSAAPLQVRQTLQALIPSNDASRDVVITTLL